MMTTPKRIIIEPDKQPTLEGVWTVGEVQAAAEFLSRWLAAQQLTQPKASRDHLD